jgi:hypothetical protein
MRQCECILHVRTPRPHIITHVELLPSFEEPNLLANNQNREGTKAKFTLEMTQMLYRRLPNCQLRSLRFKAVDWVGQCHFDGLKTYGNH